MAHLMDLFLVGNFSDYIAECEKKLHVAVDHGNIVCLLNNIAFAEFELELYRKCIKTCYRVMEKSSGDIRAHCLLVKALMKLGKNEQCVEVCESVLSISKNSNAEQDISLISEIKNLKKLCELETIGKKETIIEKDLQKNGLGINAIKISGLVSPPEQVEVTKNQTAELTKNQTIRKNRTVSRHEISSIDCINSLNEEEDDSFDIAAYVNSELPRKQNAARAGATDRARPCRAARPAPSRRTVARPPVAGQS